MNRGLSLLGAVGFGAGLMYFLDPDRGRRRRGLLRDKTTSVLARADKIVNKTGRDLAQRTAGIVAEAASALHNHHHATDEVLAERVRSRLGRACTHPRSLQVTVRNGRVAVSGPILADDVNHVLRAIAGVRGVKGVEDRLQVHEEAGNVSSLQGAGRPPGSRLDILQVHWAPATRLVAGLVGCALMGNCLTRRSPLSVLLGTAGFGLLLRGLTNLEFKELLGFGQPDRGIHFMKTIHIAAPVEQVFSFWSHFPNFPHFMTHIREVRDLGGGKSRWTAEGPVGLPVRWDAVVTQFEPNRLLAWESLPGSAVSNCGMVRFEPNDNGGTRVHLRMSYLPPAGVLGHAVAALFGADPKKEMDDDLMRMKTFIETGHVPHDAAAGPWMRSAISSGDHAKMLGPAKKDLGRPGSGQGRVDITGRVPEDVRVDPEITEGHAGYEESGDSELQPPRGSLPESERPKQSGSTEG